MAKDENINHLKISPDDDFSCSFESATSIAISEPEWVPQSLGPDLCSFNMRV